MNIKAIIMIVLVVLMLASLVGSLADDIHSTRYRYVSDTDHNLTSTNVTGASGTILNLITLIIAVGIVMIVVKSMVKGK